MKKSILLLALMLLLISACAPSSPSVENTPLAAPIATQTSTALPPTATASPVPPTARPEPTATSTPETLFPVVTFSEQVVCRLGTDLNYYKVVTFAPGQTSQAQGRSQDGEWLIVDSKVPNKNPTCWVPVTSVEKFGEVSNLLVSSPPPLPIGPNRASSTKGVCGVNTRGAIVVEWGPVQNGTGYFLYRNGKNIATIYGNRYIERDTPGSKTPYVYTYGIQAFNNVGLSKLTASVSVTLCD